MSVVLVGTHLTDPLVVGKRFRVTWTFWGASILPAFMFNPTVAASYANRWLPTVGCVPTYYPVATAGDEVVVFDFMLTAQWTGKFTKELVSTLTGIPIPMHVTRLEAITTAAVPRDAIAAIVLGNREANPIMRNVAAALGTTVDVIALAAAAVVIGGLVYFSRKR